MRAAARTLCLALLILPSVGPARAASEPSAAFVGATIFDGTGRPPITDGVLLLKGERITAVGRRGEVKIPAGVPELDVTGKWIVPGLIDAHVHLFQSASLYTRPDIVDLRHARPYAEELAALKAEVDGQLRRTLASGITAIVDVGGPFWNFDVRERARTTPQAPRVAVAGPLISTVERPQVDLGDPPFVKVTTPEEAKAEVRRQLDSDPDLIKFWYIVSEERPWQASVELLKAVVEQAHAGKTRVAVHATQLETARAALQAGVDVLVHGVDDAPLDPAFIALLQERRIPYTTTLAALKGYVDVLGGDVQLLDIERRLGSPRAMGSWDELAAVGDAAALSPKVARWRKRWAAARPLLEANLRAVHAAGVVVAAGTDAGNIGTLHGPSLHRELAMMVSAGLTPQDALLAATRDAARVFAANPEIGTLEAGKLADLLLLDGDPLADVSNLQRIVVVVKGGKAFEPAQLQTDNPEWVVQRQLDAYNARDLETFVQVYAPDVEVINLASGESVAKGRDAMRAIYGPVFDKSPKLRCELLRRTVEGPTVIDHELVFGLRGGPTIRATAAYEVRRGLIRRLWFLPR